MVDFEFVVTNCGDVIDCFRTSSGETTTFFTVVLLFRVEAKEATIIGLHIGNIKEPTI
jgi:hypothetical protein